MPDNNELQPIIVKKVHKGHKAHSTAWKVAFADFMTAMMAFFIVMWVLAQSQSMKAALAAYFKDPTGVTNKRGRSFVEMKSEKITTQTVQRVTNLNEQKKLKVMKERLVKELENNPTFKEMTKNIQVTFTKEGMVIDLLKSDVYFEVGSAVLKPSASGLIQEIGTILSELPNHISVYGYTDARPFSRRIKGYDNFNLSADRSNAARFSLIKGGMPEFQFDEIRGFADRNLKDPDNPLDDINRRISILVKYAGDSDSLMVAPMDKINESIPQEVE